MPKETWTEDQAEQLRTLWAEGLSESQIGARIGVSKHGVHTKAKRLGLPSRASPIKPRPAPTPPVQRAGAVTLPPLPSLTADHS